ncbi:hypothetical protein Hanom_Chr03g00181561 [Helianthus anomalus]
MRGPWFDVPRSKTVVSFMSFLLLISSNMFLRLLPVSVLDGPFERSYTTFSSGFDC